MKGKWAGRLWRGIPFSVLGKRWSWRVSPWYRWQDPLEQSRHRL